MTMVEHREDDRSSVNPGMTEVVSIRAGDTVEAAARAENVPVLDETLSVSKREVMTGRVRVATRTELREELAESVLEHSLVDVTRVKVDRVVDTAPQVRIEGDTTIVPVLEERLVVTKQLVLVEELHIRHRVERTVERTPVTLRRQNVTVEHLDPDEPAAT